MVRQARRKKVSKKKLGHRQKNVQKKTIKKRSKPKKCSKNSNIEICRKRTLTRENKYQLRKKRFRAWKCDKNVIAVLQARGWKYVGEPIKDGRTNYPKSIREAAKEKRIDRSDCLIWADDDDGEALSGYCKRHLVASIAGAFRALTKTHQQKMFNEFKWFPQCFTLPKETKALKQYIKQQKKDTYWICKPRNGYGGYGMSVYKAGSKAFRRDIFTRKSEFAIQRYMDNPYLVAGRYKFHARCYLVITNVQPLKAYLWKDCQFLFATVPFDLNQIEDKFNKYCHLTNYHISNEKKNWKNMCEVKPGIGLGTEWEGEYFFNYMEKKEPKFSTDSFWTQLTDICTVVAQKLVNSPYVQKALREQNACTENHYELYGIDVLMNDKFELSITEANTQPGLDWTNPQMHDGSWNPRMVKSNLVTAGIINDTLTLLNLDGRRKFFSPFIKLH